MNNSTTVTISAAASAAGAAIKRRKKLHQYQSLIPGLPDDIAQICLSHVQPSTLYSVCHSWRRLVYSSSFPCFLSVYSLLKPSQSEKNSVDFANFDPVSAKWTLLPPPPLNPPLRILLRHPSFISRHLPIQSWDMNRNNRNHSWEKMNCLKDGKFSREAIEAVGWRGKLCMVNVKGDAAKEGIIYDVESDTWQEMPEGMLMGWRGPAAAMEEEIIYTVDESKGALRKYDHRRDCWLDILENEMLKGARHMAAAGGRVCVVSGGGEGIVVVDVVAELPRLVVVETPVGFQVLDVHILPRISQLDSE
ncbi:F-box/kelch-repeat protein SKIP25 [Capsicum chinense]|nr:F-box/kelch-repeat protein SKIP25 [Capsicum chinense]